MRTGAARGSDGIANFRVLVHVSEGTGAEVYQAAAGDEAAETPDIKAVGGLNLLGCGGGR